LKFLVASGAVYARTDLELVCYNLHFFLFNSFFFFRFVFILIYFFNFVFYSLPFSLKFFCLSFTNFYHSLILICFFFSLTSSVLPFQSSLCFCVRGNTVGVKTNFPKFLLCSDVDVVRDYMTFKNVTGTFFRNVVNRLSLYAVPHLTRTKT